jgi:hypothetical protein
LVIACIHRILVHDPDDATDSNSSGRVAHGCSDCAELSEIWCSSGFPRDLH